MDLKALKLEVLERIANMEDEARLLALKRLLDGPPTYAVPGDHLTVVREGEAPYLKLEDRMYTAEEVRKVVEEVLRHHEQIDPAKELSQEEWDALDADHAAYLRGEGKNYTWDEVRDQLRKDREE
jgi:hypothetical protein